MSKTVIQVNDLSKRYRLGEKEKNNTFAGQIINSITYPIKNLRNISRLTKFKDTEDSTEFWALKDINFEVKEGEVLGIIGKNGAGKSTLLKILSRITEPTKGEIKIYGRISALLEVGTGFHPELTGRDNIYMNGTILGMTKKEIDSKFDEIVDFSGVEKHIDTPVKFYSSGMKVRLGFSVAAHLEPEILVIDEVLAVGDADFRKKCLGKMKQVSKNGRTVLFVSHDMGSIKNLCSTVFLINKGTISLIGKPDEVIKYYLNNENVAFNENETIRDVDKLHRRDDLGRIFRFTKCSILNSEGNNVKRLLFGEPFSIGIELISTINNAEIHLYVGISSPIGERIASGVVLVNTEVHKIIKGIITINDLKLNPGIYTIFLAIRRHDQIDDAFPFEVLNDTFKNVEPYMDNRGFIGLNLNWVKN
jgi:lipopolysaccharide transport system ATP-binding protein